MSADDPQVAVRVAIDDPLGKEDCSPTLKDLDKFVQEMSKSKNQDGKEVFKSVLTALLDLRKRLPPIYNLSAQNIMVDKATGQVQIMVTDDMFKKESNCVDLELTDLLYKSPEELLGKGKSLTTPFWVLGCQLFEARFGLSPFKTHLKQQVCEMFIKFYPVMFPED